MPATDPAVTPPQANDSYRLFRQIVPPALINARQPSAKQAVYTAFVTTWLLILQRLHGGASLNDAVTALLFCFPQEDLPDCKRLRDDAVSANSGAFSKARSRLDLEVAVWLADHVFTSLSALSRPAWKDRRVQLLDGSTFSLAATPVLRQAYPPASNQHGPSHWPILRVVVAHDLDSGLVCRPEYGPVYGPQNECESVLTRRLLPRLAPALMLGDGNFGIFIVAYDAKEAGHDVLLRLSEPRFRALARKGKPAGEGRWSVTWKPSKKEREKYNLPEGASVKGYITEQRRIDPDGKEHVLYLFSTLEEGTNAEWADLYTRRWCVETDIEVEKITLGLDQVSAKSKEMVEKEVVLATVAYNLVVQVRRLAAARAGIDPRRLSFSGTLSLLKGFEAKISSGLLSEEELQHQFDKLLRAIGQRKLPNRKPGRKYPREVIPRGSPYPKRKRPPPQAPPAPDAAAFPARQ
jgi:hypothetical protein